jgi:chromosome segregation ATPase
LSDTRSKFDKEKKAAQQKYDDWIKRFKTSRDDKIAATKKSHDTALGKLQDKYNKEKEKVRDLNQALEEAETKRKDVEKSAAKKVRDALADLDAGERDMKEKKKQMAREMQEKVDLLKPEHSKIVKEKDRNVTELAQKVVQLERDLKGSERHMYDVRKEAAAEKSRHDNCKNQLSQAKMNLAAADKKVKELSGFAEKTQHRAETDKVRAKEKIELAVNTRNEQSQRLILQQRENYELKDTVRKLAKLGGEKRDEVERLKAELMSTKAELGVAKDMESMDDALDQETSATMASPPGDMGFE